MKTHFTDPATDGFYIACYSTSDLNSMYSGKNPGLSLPIC